MNTNIQVIYAFKISFCRDYYYLKFASKQKFYIGPINLHFWSMRVLLSLGAQQTPFPFHFYYKLPHKPQQDQGFCMELSASLVGGYHLGRLQLLKRQKNWVKYSFQSITGIHLAARTIELSRDNRLSNVTLTFDLPEWNLQMAHLLIQEWNCAKLLQFYLYV